MKYHDQSNNIKTSTDDEVSAGYEALPCVLIGLIESYLPASSICSLSSTSRQNRDRWNPKRWKLTFNLHTTSMMYKGTGTNPEQRKSTRTDRWERYHRINFGEWENSFVPCCCCQQCKFLNLIGNETQFNVNALVPSIKRAYGELWDRIELSMLGYSDVASSSDYHVTQQDVQPNGGWNMFTSGLRVTSKVVRLLLEPFFMKAYEQGVFPKRRAMKLRGNDVDRMCPWKLACLVKESGVNCSRCRLCDKIDVSSKMELGEQKPWITPCACCEPVHRKCLESQLLLNQKLNIQVPWNRSSNVPKMWVSYDSPTVIGRALNHPASVDGSNQFITSKAECNHCGEKYKRALRLPRGIREVVFSSLSDPLAIARAFSTFAHFMVCILCIASVEAKYKHESCEGNFCLSEHWLHLQWTHRKWKLIACAWWQLQQSCMLHILFSPRFMEIVDRIFLARSVALFYVKLYIYFVLTSIVLAISFLPMVTRQFHDNAVNPFLSDKQMEMLSPIWDMIAIGNLLNYAISSTTVIAIFWRTNYRVYTVANRVEDPNGFSTGAFSARVEEVQNHWNDIQELTSGRRNDHPIYHGNWT